MNRRDELSGPTRRRRRRRSRSSPRRRPLRRVGAAPRLFRLPLGSSSPSGRRQRPRLPCEQRAAIAGGLRRHLEDTLMWPRWNVRPTLLPSLATPSGPRVTGSLIVGEAPPAPHAASASSRQSSARSFPAGARAMSVPQRSVTASVARPRGRPPPTCQAPAEAVPRSGLPVDRRHCCHLGPGLTRGARSRRRPPDV
jgi:hypothetical protein